MSSPEHFTKTLFGGGARSSLGYKISFNSPKSVEYVDGETKIFISAEPLAPKQTIQLFRAHVTVGSSDGPIVADEGLRARAGSGAPGRPVSRVVDGLSHDCRLRIRADVQRGGGP